MPLSTSTLRVFCPSLKTAIDVAKLPEGRGSHKRGFSHVGEPPRRKDTELIAPRRIVVSLCLCAFVVASLGPVRGFFRRRSVYIVASRDAQVSFRSGRGGSTA